MLTDGHWLQVSSADPRVFGLYRRHYSSAKRPKTATLQRCTGPGEQLALLTESADAVFLWRSERYRLDDQVGINCSLFRNEGDVLSSVLVAEADAHAWSRWPDVARHFTFVDPRRIASSNPGYCFLKAGWRRCGRTARGLVILERSTN